MKKIIAAAVVLCFATIPALSQTQDSIPNRKWPVQDTMPVHPRDTMNKKIPEKNKQPADRKRKSQQDTLHRKDTIRTQ